MSCHPWRTSAASSELATAPRPLLVTHPLPPSAGVADRRTSFLWEVQLRCELSNTPDDLETAVTKLTLMGFIGLSDTPRATQTAGDRGADRERHQHPHDHR